MESFIKWIGGKKLLRKQIIERFPEKFDRYVEVFGGAGWVLFGSDTAHAKFEVFNDINSELINLYRCVKYHCGELARELAYLPQSREIFYNMRDIADKFVLTDIQRAARYFYLISNSFGANMYSFSTRANGNTIESKIEHLNEIAKRLKNVIIENKSYDNLIDVYDRESALFYLDPPYVNAEKYYKIPFGEEEHIKLAGILKNIKGKFILSYNCNPLILELYKDFNIAEITRKNSLKVSRGKCDDYEEVIITNY